MIALVAVIAVVAFALGYALTLDTRRCIYFDGYNDGFNDGWEAVDALRTAGKGEATSDHERQHSPPSTDHPATQAGEAVPGVRSGDPLRRPAVRFPWTLRLTEEERHDRN